MLGLLRQQMHKLKEHDTSPPSTRFDQWSVILLRLSLVFQCKIIHRFTALIFYLIVDNKDIIS